MMLMFFALNFKHMYLAISIFSTRPYGYFDKSEIIIAIYFGVIALPLMILSNYFLVELFTK